MTPRQAQIAALVATGASNKEIAARLDIAEGTVKQHLHAIYQALAISGRVQLSLYLTPTARMKMREDLEVFYSHSGKWSFDSEGWYWTSTLREETRNPIGPFKTEKEAYRNAEEFFAHLGNA